MSRYEEEIGQLTEWFNKRLTSLDPFQMTEEDYQIGVHRLPESLSTLTTEAFNHWLAHREYELSYNQTCIAFFRAAYATNKITLVPRHPIFRLKTKVFIREVSIRGTNEKMTNVPGTISSITGDDHIVTGEVEVENDRAGKWCVVVSTKDLQKELILR